MKLVDLSVFAEETLDFKLTGGEIVKTKKPTERMIIRLAEFKNLNTDDMTEKDFLSLSDKLVLMILSNNEEGRTFKKEDIKELTTDMKSAVIAEFFKFATKLTTQKN